MRPLTVGGFLTLGNKQRRTGAGGGARGLSLAKVDFSWLNESTPPPGYPSGTASVQERSKMLRRRQVTSGINQMTQDVFPLQLRRVNFRRDCFPVPLVLSQGLIPAKQDRDPGFC